MVTISVSLRNSTEPKTQGLLNTLPSNSATSIDVAFLFAKFFKWFIIGALTMRGNVKNEKREF